MTRDGQLLCADVLLQQEIHCA